MPFSVWPPTPYWKADSCWMMLPGPVVKTTPGVVLGPGGMVYRPTGPGPASNAFWGGCTEKLEEGFNCSCTS